MFEPPSRENNTWSLNIFFLRKFFFLEEIRVCNSLQKQLSFSSVGWIYLLVKRIECIPRSTRLLRLFFRSLSFSCHFSDFFGKMDKRMDNVISQHRRTLNVCRKPTKTRQVHNVGYLGNLSWRNYSWFIYWRTTTLLVMLILI